MGRALCGPTGNGGKGRAARSAARPGGAFRFSGNSVGPLFFSGTSRRRVFSAGPVGAGFSGLHVGPRLISFRWRVVVNRAQGFQLGRIVSVPFSCSRCSVGGIGFLVSVGNLVSSAECFCSVQLFTLFRRRNRFSGFRRESCFVGGMFLFRSVVHVVPSADPVS